MAKTLIRNVLGGKSFSFYVPATDEKAQEFCATILEGEYEGLIEKGVEGNDTVTGGYNKVTVLIEDNAGQKLYLNMACPITKSEEDIYNALNGVTLNGVHADKLYVTRMSRVG